MSAVPVIVHGRDRFRIECRDAGDGALRYVVVDTAGVALRHELNLDDAKAWIERMVEACPARERARGPRR